MSPRKLTEDDKQEILQLYRTSKATTSTLANQYEVSSSTISRFLKNNLSQSEYEELIQQKRLARTPRGDQATDNSSKPKSAKKIKSKSKTTAKAPSAKSSTKTVAAIDKAKAVSDSDTASTSRRRRRRSASTMANDPEAQLEEQKNLQLELETTVNTPDEQSDIEPVELKPSDRLILKKDKLDEAEDEEIERVEVITLKEMLGEDVEDEEEDDEEDDDWELETDEDISYPHADKDFGIQIMPLSSASLPRTCYLVIDRSAELIVKPLKDFADLGSIPETEIKQKTLPVFDNHRIAKRFSHRRERVIKVPDSRILHKTSHYLEAKGITRLLIDGKIYSLSSEV